MNTFTASKRWNREEAEIPLRRPHRTPEMLLAAFLYGLTWPIKPLTLLTAPFIIPQLGLAGIGSLVIWGGYIWWSQRWEFGRHQARFLLHQLFIHRIKPSGPTPPRFTRRISLVTRLWHTFSWRWNHLGRHAVMALPFATLLPVSDLAAALDLERHPPGRDHHPGVWK
jgi:hypothetical protein